MDFPKELLGGIWHTTNPERYQQILLDEAILPEPPTVNNADRWKTGRGEELYPYVRKIGGVSLFDFRNFNKVKYSQDYPISSWQTFVPRLRKWPVSIWIEINLNLVSSNIILGNDLIIKWKQEEAYKNTIMPEIEVAHIGALPTKAFLRILAYDGKSKCFKDI